MEYVDDECGHSIYSDGFRYCCPSLSLHAFASEDGLRRAIRRTLSRRH